MVAIANYKYRKATEAQATEHLSLGYIYNTATSLYGFTDVCSDGAGKDVQGRLGLIGHHSESWSMKRILECNIKSGLHIWQVVG